MECARLLFKKIKFFYSHFWYGQPGASYNKNVSPVFKKNGINLSQCCISSADVSNDGMRPGCLQWDMKTNQKTPKDKPEDFFVTEFQCLICMTLDSSTDHWETAELMEASRKLSLHITKKNGRSHVWTDRQHRSCSQWLLWMLCLVLRASRVIRNPLSNNTEKHCIDKIAEGMKTQVSEKIRFLSLSSPYSVQWYNCAP